MEKMEKTVIGIIMHEQAVVEVLGEAFYSMLMAKSMEVVHFTLVEGQVDMGFGVEVEVEAEVELQFTVGKDLTHLICQLSVVTSWSLTKDQLGVQEQSIYKTFHLEILRLLLITKDKFKFHNI